MNITIVFMLVFAIGILLGAAVCRAAYAAGRLRGFDEGRRVGHRRGAGLPRTTPLQDGLRLGQTIRDRRK